MSNMDWPEFEPGRRPAGSICLGKVAGAPVFVHWSVLVASLVFLGFAHFDLSLAAGLCIGYLSLIVAHEFGHVAAARLCGVPVYAVHISAAGGLCYSGRPRTARHAVLLFSSGLIAQMMIFALTIAVVELRGMPQTVFGGGLVTSFTALNAFVLVSNLIPTRTPKGFATDGYVLWKLLRHLTGHHPNPVPAFVPVAESPIFPPDTSLLAMPGLIPRGFTTGIEVLNDAKTPMLFVVETLARHLKISSAEATALMLNVHAKGGMLIGLPKDEARAVAEGVRADALASGHPLICRAVEMECQRDG